MLAEKKKAESEKATQVTLQDLLREKLESNLAQLCIIGLVLIDFLSIQLLLYYGIFYPVSSNSFASTLSSNDSGFWLTFASVSIIANIIYLLEMLIRIYAWGLAFFASISHWFDLILVLAVLPLKLALPANISLIVQSMILLRLWRVLFILDAMQKRSHEEINDMIANVTAEKDKLLALEKSKVSQLEARLTSSNSKLEKLLGERPVSKPINMF
jgi:hypothetical protein